eukprot:9490136-Pyramimonas_sp.AAC.1
MGGLSAASTPAPTTYHAPSSALATDTAGALVFSEGPQLTTPSRNALSTRARFPPKVNENCARSLAHDNGTLPAEHIHP